MTWLLDTCVLSDFARGEAGTLRRLKAASPAEIAVSAITVMEVEYGLARAPVRAALEGKGRPIGAYDLLIAGCALSRGMALVSSNTREFGRVSGLRVENWRG